MSATKRFEAFREKYGPWAVVTGASSGIGRAIALELGARGVNVVAVARNRSALDSLLGEFKQRFAASAMVVSADLATDGGFAALCAATEDLDIGLLVAAAGFGTSGEFLKANLQLEAEMLELNCGAVLRQSLHFGRRLAARRRGGLILMGSLVGFQGVPYSASYAATKAYVQTLAEGLHLELASHGVDVLASAPGPVRSGFEERANMRMRAALSPADVAAETLNALGRRTTVVPGLLSKVLTYSLAPLPRPMRSRIMGRVMGDMTKHQRDSQRVSS